MRVCTFVCMCMCGGLILVVVAMEFVYYAAT